MLCDHPKFKVVLSAFAAYSLMDFLFSFFYNENVLFSQICNAVAVAGLLNAILVIPRFHFHSVWMDPRQVIPFLSLSRMQQGYKLVLPLACSMFPFFSPMMFVALSPF